jgi:hypothetical protein
MKNTILLFIIALAFASSSCEKHPEVQYRYDIYGNDSCLFSVTILNKNNELVKYDSVPTSWCCVWLQTEPRRLYISASNITDTTPVTVAIYRDNVLLDSVSSEKNNTLAILQGVY